MVFSRNVPRHCSSLALSQRPKGFAEIKLQWKDVTQRGGQCEFMKVI